MRLATWNILHGRSMSDATVDIDRFARAIATLDADVLALQEVDRAQPRSSSVDLTAVAAEAMGATERLFVPARIGEPARARRAAHEHDVEATSTGYGIALLSRYPVLRWQVLRFPPSMRLRAPTEAELRRRRHGGPASPERSVRRLREEPRAAIAATIRTPFGDWTVACAHLTFLPGTNVRQLRRTMGWLRQMPGPRVLMGDLNLPPAAVSRVAGARLLARGATFPAGHPMVQIDHVLSGDPLPRSRQIRVPRPPLSDHLPLVVEFPPDPLL
ncbi:endonuclease/exonuclease/phosphatase family protein [Agrococcus beijingensis]|uniref:endonuclease/exonuclease/phosphatase family protein n=1 Tax=Agrococcus beijingensis TaxID=3068634 RepID=UPI0027409F7F|nr:endonuclease/exonuclease/phosphatase family protein [Agrococcus sp. REN33]